MKYLAFVLVLLASAGAHGWAQASADPDRVVSGSGIQVDGWQGRTDRSEQKIGDIRFIEWNGGFRLTSGPHAIVWNPANRASGDYTVTARVSKTRESISTHEESYGLFIGGNDLTGPRWNYLYCVVFGTGTVMVRHRGGSETATLLGKTANPAISRDGGNSATDEIALWVRDGRVGCSVNGAEVFSAATSDMIGPGKLISTDGVFGLRASHNLDVIIERLSVAPVQRDRGRD
ncbi:MAG TPA: hypothetical protein VF981_12935 [Gemmatimonadaceae bacterium]